MPAEPSARDRAGEVPPHTAAARIVEATIDALPAARRLYPDTYAAEVVDALLAAPNLLSALAGVPRPGVEAFSDPGPLPRRHTGWSVERPDGSSTFGEFPDRATADEWQARLTGYGHDVVVRESTMPDRWAGVERLLARCDELDRRFRPDHPQYAAIGTHEVRALLGHTTTDTQEG